MYEIVDIVFFFFKTIHLYVYVIVAGTVSCGFVAKTEVLKPRIFLN